MVQQLEEPNIREEIFYDSCLQLERIIFDKFCVLQIKKMATYEETGLTHECGVFGCVAAGDWPTQVDVAQVICLGLVALQHR